MKFLTYLGGLVVVALISFFLVVKTVPSVHSWYRQLNQNANQEIFTKSKPFVNGSIQQLVKLKLDYDLAEDSDHKAAILYTAKVQYANLDKSKVPYDIQQWLNQ